MHVHEHERKHTHTHTHAYNTHTNTHKGNDMLKYGLHPHILALLNMSFVYEIKG